MNIKRNVGSKQYEINEAAVKIILTVKIVT